MDEKFWLQMLAISEFMFNFAKSICVQFRQKVKK